MNKSRIIHLIGSIKYINIASNEIQNFIFLKGFGVKVIENNKLINELKRGVKRDIYINKCNEFSYKDIYKINKIYKSINIHYNYLSYPLLIHPNNEIENNLMKYLYNNYNINENDYIKNNIIKNILFYK